MKSSFILHLDSLCILDKLSDEQAGRLFRAIYEYHKTKQVPQLDLLLDMALTPFINQFLRDDVSYQKIVERNRKNGELGGRPRKEEEPKEPSGLLENPDNPKNPVGAKKADSDSDSVSDNGSNTTTTEKKVLGLEKVRSYANRVWKDLEWRSAVIKTFNLKSESIMLKWMEQFNLSISTDEGITGHFDEIRYKKMFKGLLNKLSKERDLNQPTVTNGTNHTTTAPPLTTINL